LRSQKKKNDSKVSLGEVGRDNDFIRSFGEELDAMKSLEIGIAGVHASIGLMNVGTTLDKLELGSANNDFGQLS
jgi:hypothetical protein